MQAGSKLRTSIDEIVYIGQNPKEAITKATEAGIKMVGCSPYYVPEEIIYAANMLPVGLWGGQVSISESKAYMPAFACSIMQSLMELGLTGHYDVLSGIIVTSMCDTLKCVGQNLKSALPRGEVIQFVHPQMRKLDAGIEFLKTEYQLIRKRMEEISGKEISEEALNSAILVYNTYRATMRDFVDVASEHTDIITPTIRHAIVKSAFFIDKAKHTEIVRVIIDELRKLTVAASTDKKMLLTGIMAEPHGLLVAFEQNHMVVVADDLAQETRQFRYDVPAEGTDALQRLAKWWSVMEGCSLAYDPQKKRFEMIIDDVKKYKADGVVMCMMKFCDPEEYDYPILKKALEKEGIPHLYLEIDQQMGDDQQARTRIQSFAEMLRQ
jgi:bcr-type benzoyl-CoA reductase subunit C